MVDCRGAFDEFPDGVTVHHPADGSILETNRRFREMLGYDRDELLGLDFTDLFDAPSAYASEGAREYHRKATTEGPQMFEWVMQTKDGKPYPVEVNLRLGTIDGEELILAVTRDIAHREGREDQFRTLHGIAVGLESCETEEEICERTVDAAEEVLEMYLCYVGLVEGDVIVPKASSSQAGPEYVREIPVGEGLAGKTLETGESYLIGDLPTHDVPEPVRDEYRSGMVVPLGDLGVFQAVSTERHRFDEKDLELAETLVAHATESLKRVRSRAVLHRQNERLNQFASIVSHDLRNPLNLASGRIALAREECDSEHLDEVVRAHQRMEALIDNLLELARQGGQVEAYDAVKLSELVDTCWRYVATEDATLVNETDRTVHADENRLRQLLENLVGNAIAHGGPGVTVTVADLPDGFFVEDDGPGIPSDKRDDIFEVAYSTSGDGTGLGLWIVHQVADDHGWTVAVTDGADGGARFEITGVEFA